MGSEAEPEGAVNSVSEDIAMSPRSSTSRMKGRGISTELIENIDRLKKIHHQNFIEKIVNDDNDEDEATVTETVCKVLNSALIVSHSTIMNMPASSGISRSSLSEGIFHSMNALFPDELTSWFVSSSNGDQNRDSFIKYIRKCIKICVAMRAIWAMNR